MRTKNILNRVEVDGIFVTNILNVKYLTGFTGTTGVALVTRNKRYFITDFRYHGQALNQVTKNGFEVVIENVATMKVVGELIRKEGIKKLGIENQSVSLAQFESFKTNFGNIEYVNLDDKFVKVREIKSQEEIEITKESIRIAEKALELTMPIIKVGTKETEIVAELEYHMKKMGAEKASFDIIVASNERSALPHGVATEKIVEEGFLTIDYGCFYKGYASDITRTFYIGENPTEKHIEIYNIVKEANEMAIAAVKPGISTKELDKIARDYIASKGYGDKFGHGLGHGIGLQIHEYPSVSYKAEDKILTEGMILTIEPGIYLPDFGGVRIEDDVLVTKEGKEVLTTLPKELKRIF